MSLAYFAKIRKSVKKLNLEDLIRNLKNALSKAHKTADRDFLLKHLTYLQEKGLDNPATKKDLDFILKDIEKTLGQKLESLAEAPFLQASMEAYTEGKRKVCKPFKIDYSLDDADLGALNTLDEFNGWYIRDKFSKDTSDIINRELSDLLERGGTKREFAKTLEIALEGHVEESKTYWELLADHTLTKIQNMGHVSGYETAGVQCVKIVAVIDNKTTPICRAMNNKVFKVADFRKQYDKIIRAAEKHDLKAYKAAQPMVSGKAMKGEITDKEIEKLGIKLPPYHFRCRTTHVAYFEGERELRRPEKDDAKSRARNEGKNPGNLMPTKEEEKSQLENISKTLQTLSQKFPSEFKHGFKEIKIIPHIPEYENAYMYTSCDGRFAVSNLSHLVWGEKGKSLIQYIPIKHLSDTLYKISNNQSKELQYIEYVALKDLYHELWHNKQIPSHVSDIQRLAMENLNEYCTRFSFPSFLRKLNIPVKYEKELIYHSTTYSDLFNNFKDVLNEYKISKRNCFAELQKINTTSKWNKILFDVSKYIAENSGLRTKEWNSLTDFERIEKVKKNFEETYSKIAEARKKMIEESTKHQKES